MSFVGIVANDRDFKNIRKTFEKKDISKSISIVEINENNIENMRNIVFETIIFCRELKHSKKQSIYLDEIIKKSSYLVINSDFNSHTIPSFNKECTIITFGLNQKATITVSSISENGFVISLQHNIKKSNNDIQEMEEKCIKTKNPTNFKLYKILVEYIIKIIYSKK